MTPKNFLTHPFDSIFSNSETETVARNIMAILFRSGDAWRTLSWDEYVAERTKDGNFTQSEKKYFDNAIKYCVSEEMARKFSKNWGK